LVEENRVGIVLNEVDFALGESQFERKSLQGLFFFGRDGLGASALFLTIFFEEVVDPVDGIFKLLFLNLNFIGM
jgi:hypothetical protein